MSLLARVMILLVRAILEIAGLSAAADLMESIVLLSIVRCCDVCCKCMIQD